MAPETSILAYHGISASQDEHLWNGLHLSPDISCPIAVAQEQYAVCLVR